MLDVHPPHTPTHTWKDFFIHIATITVGLLIAVGLEQTVEAIHHRHQLTELREGLRQDNEKALRDEEAKERYLVGLVAWHTANMDEAREALRTKTQPHYLPIPQDMVRAEQAVLSEPTDPTWQAAKASNLIEVMPQEDIKAFSEIDWMIGRASELSGEKSVGRYPEGFIEQFRIKAASDTLDLSTATRADIVQYLTLLSGYLSNAKSSIVQSQYLRGALQAVLRGERNLDKIDLEENQVRDGPPLPPAK